MCSSIMLTPCCHEEQLLLPYRHTLSTKPWLGLVPVNSDVTAMLMLAVRLINLTTSSRDCNGARGRSEQLAWAHHPPRGLLSIGWWS